MPDRPVVVAVKQGWRDDVITGIRSRSSDTNRWEHKRNLAPWGTASPTAFDTFSVKLATIRLCVSNSLPTARIFSNYRVSNPPSSNASTPQTSGSRQDWEFVSTSLTLLTQRFRVCPRGNIKCCSLSTFAPSTPSSKPTTMSPTASLLSANARWAEATDPALFERCAKGQSPKVCITSY